MTQPRQYSEYPSEYMAWRSPKTNKPKPKNKYKSPHGQRKGK